MSAGRLNIEVLGTSFSIEANEDDDYLNRIYEHYVNVLNNTAKTSSLKDPVSLAIMAGILITDELYKAQLEKGGVDNLEIERCALQMIEKIDKTISEV